MPCPAVMTLKNCLEQTVPFLTGQYTESNDSQQSRLQQGRDGGFNRHDAGLALDIFLFAEQWYKDKKLDWKNEKILGEHLVKAFVDYRNQMNWTEIIFQDVIFRHEPDDFNYKSGSYAENRKHYTHIHIDWMDNSLKGVIKNPPIPWSAQAKLTQFSSSLMTRLTEVNEKWQKGYLSSMDLKSI